MQPEQRMVPRDAEGYPPSDLTPTPDSLSAIERCPNEILVCIKEELYELAYDARRAILRLRLTCRRLNSVFTPFTVNTISYSLEILESDGPPAKLILSDLKSWFDLPPFCEPIPEAFAPYISDISIDLFPKCSRVSPEEVKNELSPLWTELSRFTSLRTLHVSWKTNYLSDDIAVPLYDNISGHLLTVVHHATGGQLRSVDWSYPHFHWVHSTKPISQLLSSFSGIQELSLAVRSSSKTGVDAQVVFPSELGSFLLLNPQLRSLSLKCDSLHAICKTEELFPPGVDKLALETLIINGIPPNTSLQVDDLSRPSPHSLSRTLPSMPNLKQLFITIPKNLYLVGPDSPNFDLLWNKLKESGARLGRLSLFCGISDALMDYLSSYRGLDSVDFNLFTHSLTLTSSSFVDTVLPLHAPSISSLSITTEDRQPSAGWEAMQFDALKWPSPSMFANLTRLSCVTPPPWRLESQHCQTILDYATQIPNLEELEVFWSRPLSTPRRGFHDRVCHMAENVLIRRCKLANLYIVASFVVGYSTRERASWELEFPRPVAGSSSGDEEGEEERVKLSKFAYDYPESDSSFLDCF
ncbi:hypothetical protein AX16_007539 [Volvariella volvacea WC 439]|nr:hypothetical protein AX16_007539 [Volvariella volvacea WC 439]